MITWEIITKSMKTHIIRELFQIWKSENQKLKSKYMTKSLILISTPSQAFFLSQTPDVASNSILLLTVNSEDSADKDAVNDFK